MFSIDFVDAEDWDEIPAEFSAGSLFATDNIFVAAGVEIDESGFTSDERKEIIILFHTSYLVFKGRR